MPHATPIPAVSNPIAPVLKSVHETATASSTAASQSFRELFREKTGSIEIPVAKAVQGAATNSAHEDQLPSNPETAALSDREDQNQIGPLPSGSTGTIAQIASKTSLELPLHAAAVITNAKAPGSGPTSYPTTEPETASPAALRQIQSPLDAASQAKDEGKIRKRPHANEQSNTRNVVIGTPLPTSALSDSSVLTSSATLSSAKDKSSSSHANPSATAATPQPPASDTGDSAADYAIRQSAFSQPASSKVTANASPTINGHASADAKSAGREAAAAMPEDSAPSKESSEAESSAAPASGTLAHAAHASTESSSLGAPAVTASAAVPAGSHPGTAAAASPPAPRAEQAIPGAPVTSTTPSAATSYDKLDEGAVPTVLQTGAQHIAVGIRDPNLGWVEIKTQNVAGHVDAALVTASQQTHASLAAQLPAMAAYLQQHDVRIGSLAVHHQPGTTSGTSSGSAQGDSRASGSAGGSGSGQSSGSGSNPQNSRQPEPPPGTALYTGISPGLLPSQSERLEGFGPVSYISVRA